MTDWENITSFESLYRAHRKARLGKRHKKEVIEFEMNLSENLWRLHYDLVYGRYEVGGYHNFTIHDPKEREIQAISYRDRVVQHSLCDNFLLPLLERRLVYSNAACRKGKGTDFAISLLRRYMVSHHGRHGRSGYFVRIDVRKYFDSIDHALLLDKLGRIVSEPRILELLKVIIDSYSHHEGCGLPMGNQSSQCFALLYLDVLDRYVKERLRVRRYVRYMDDVVALVESRERADAVLDAARRILAENRLTLNPKSQTIPVRNGVAFLGWHFGFSDTGKIMQSVKQSSGKRIVKKAKFLAHCAERGLCDVRDLISVRESYRGYLSPRSPALASKINRLLDPERLLRAR